MESQGSPNTVGELAPGFGRRTGYLNNYSKHLIIVALAEKCISHPSEMFASASNISYHVNEDKWLAMVPSIRSIPCSAPTRLAASCFVLSQHLE